MNQPGVVLWFKVYAAALALLYLAAAAMFAVMMFLPWEAEDEMPPAWFFGLFALFCLPFAAVFLAGIFLPPKPWVWIYDLVLIAIGFGSCCILPASIALLIFWIKPETKAYFGRV